jgi:DnaJ like chaperone protein
LLWPDRAPIEPAIGIDLVTARQRAFQRQESGRQGSGRSESQQWAPLRRWKFKGKLIGALIGSLAGPIGTLLGGLLGHLFDRAKEEQTTLGSLRPGDSITAAGAKFLSSLIGLSVAVTGVGAEARDAQIAALKSFFRENFPYTEEDQRTLEWIIDESFRKRSELNVSALCRYYKSTSSPSGRLLLLRLLFKIAAVDSSGPSPEQLALIRLIAAALGVGAATVSSLQAEFHSPDRNVETLSREQAYSILGIPREAADEAVRSRYRRMAAQHHPDKVAILGEEFVAVAEEKFKLINEAYSVIGRERGWSGPER